jgi:hypothetical protein
MNYEEAVRKNQEVIEVGDRVIYVPRHADGDINHPDCEYGIVKEIALNGIFVNYVRKGIPQTTAQLTNPMFLYLEGKGFGEKSIFEIFKSLNNEGKI